MEYKEVGDFFLKNEKLHDVHFIVGDKKERIGAVRNQLINQSHVWWAMLSDDSDMVEKNDINLPDIQPEIFLLLLKHCYGGLDDEDLVAVSSDMVVSLCYCANKYLMPKLMKKIAKRLKPSSLDELFPALYCLANLNLDGVEAGVKKLVECETRSIFSHPKFLECEEEDVTFITRQEPLECVEVELWDAVVMWAKHKAGSNDETILRKLLSSPLKNIRLLTMSSDELCGSVFKINLLTKDEISEICSKSISSDDILCKITKKRAIDTMKHSGSFNIIHTNVWGSYEPCRSSSFAIIVRSQEISLNSVTCILHRGENYDKLNIFNNNKVERDLPSITLKISRIIDYLTNKQDHPITIRSKTPDYKYSDHEVTFAFPVLKIPHLAAESKYVIDFSCSRELAAWSYPTCTRGHDFKHGIFFCSSTYENECGTSSALVVKFEYGVGRG